jgi:alanine racemase
MAVVKANGYGHGAVPTAETAIACGAEALAVARIEEGLALRLSGITAPVLILGHSPASAAADLARHDLTQTTVSLPAARALSNAATEKGVEVKVHLKVDTGMGRVGIVAGEPGSDSAGGALEEIRTLCRLPRLVPEGIFTHFAAADESDKTYTEKQFRRFRYVLDRLEESGECPPIRHAANSAALVEYPETQLDMVRVGIALYGIYPSDAIDRRKVQIAPAMSLKSKIVHLKTVPPGTAISYGATYTTSKTTRIATVPVGYGDGIHRGLSNRGHMLVAGKRAPIVGRVCMDMTMLDVGEIPEADIDTEVVVFGRQGKQTLGAEEVARTLDTIGYEIVTQVTGRVPRIYRLSESE